MMRQTRLASLAAALLWILGIASAMGCGASTTAQPAESPTATQAVALTATAPATATPLAAVPDQTTSTPAGSPTPYAVPTPFELPYQVVISGPETAHPGDEVMYEIAYQCVSQTSSCGPSAQLPLGLTWTREAASLIDFSPTADIHSPLGPPVVGVVFHGTSGLDRATFRIASEFRGFLGVATYLTGTSKPYSCPECSVHEIATQVIDEWAQ